MQSKIGNFNIALLIVLAFLLQVAFSVGLYKYSPQKAVVPTQEVKVAQNEPEYALDPYISQLADEVGIDKTELRKTKPYLTSQKECGSSPDTLGCYGYRITLIDTIKTRDRYKQRVALAHEYLHYVWYHRTDRDKLKPQLMSTYLTYKAYFDYRMSSYFKSGMQVGDEQFYNELHSFVGTEVADSELTPELLQHYTEFITNRSSLPSYI